MKHKQKELLLLLLSLYHLKDKHGLKPNDIIEQFDSQTFQAAYSNFFPTGDPDKDGLIILAKTSYEKLFKTKNK